VASLHTAFGLTIRSNIPIPGLLPVSDPATRIDLEARFGASPPQKSGLSVAPEELTYVSEYADESGNPGLRIWKSSNKEYLRLEYYDGTEFWLQRDGKEIWAIWRQDSTLEDACSYLLGPVLGLLLRLRGITCLHASAVAIENHAVAFVGAEGAGKSTTAAAFAREGHGVLSEDVVALAETASGFSVIPAYPHICLWPESVALLYGSEDALPRFSKSWEKQRLSLDAGEARFENQPLPLGAVYFLEERCQDHAPRVEEMLSREALLSLVADTFANKVLDREMRAREFETLGRLMMRIPVRRVFAHGDGARIRDLCRVIREDFAAIGEARRTKY
jgi:hypothetical protein